MVPTGSLGGAGSLTVKPGSMMAMTLVGYTGDGIDGWERVGVVASNGGLAQWHSCGIRERKTSVSGVQLYMWVLPPCGRLVWWVTCITMGDDWVDWNDRGEQYNRAGRKELAMQAAVDSLVCLTCVSHRNRARSVNASFPPRAK